jgi:hypothetical protein
MTTDNQSGQIGQEKKLSRVEAAAFCAQRGYPVDKNLLDKLATRGGGPKFEKFRNRHTLYKPADLLAWLETQSSPGQAA